MRLAQLAGIDIPHATPTLGTGPGHVKRFDRTDARRRPGRLSAGGPATEQKCDRSAELCARLVRRFTASRSWSHQLFGRMVSAVERQQHAHLKNFALLTGADGVVSFARLRPAVYAARDSDDGCPPGGWQDGRPDQALGKWAVLRLPSPDRPGTRAHHRGLDGYGVLIMVVLRSSARVPA
jgi:hypothetical protein